MHTRGYNVDMQSLAVMCLVWGMGASIFSLMLSRVIAKWTMGIQLVSPTMANAAGVEGELYRTVQNLSRAAGISTMPEVGIYQSPELNAFATGPTRNRALVAVSSGLLATMNKNEIEGVLGHEITHVANGDMVTMTLIQGVVNAFVMFLSRIAAYAVSQALASRNSEREERSNPMLTWLMIMVFEVIFGLVGAMIVASFSRWREFRADAGGARLAGRENMRAALMRLRSYSERVETNNHPAIAALKISGRPRGALFLFASHPPLEERIRRLEAR
jgi:heat shock protein HtpX